MYDAGEQDGDFYMAMEFVEGQTVKTLIKAQGALPEQLVRYIFAYACRGLDYAHQHSIVHRDVKPGNMMLTRQRTLKIMDFGLAKFVEEAGSQHTRAIGTPYYMSPEQVVGRQLDGRSDIYSLGVSMFEVSTGKLPFTTGDLSYHHLHTPPPDPREFKADLSEGLSTIILKCMEKEPANRYARALDIVEELK